MIGGFYLMDCSGVNLSIRGHLRIMGFWKKSVEALKSGKPIIGYNILYDRIYGVEVPSTPVAIFGWYQSETLIYFRIANYLITVDRSSLVGFYDLLDL